MRPRPWIQLYVIQAETSGFICSLERCIYIPKVRVSENPKASPAHFRRAKGFFSPFRRGEGQLSFSWTNALFSIFPLWNESHRLPRSSLCCLQSSCEGLMLQRHCWSDMSTNTELFSWTHGTRVGARSRNNISKPSVFDKTESDPEELSLARQKVLI